MSTEALYIIDFDRTLVDVEKVMKLAEKACDEVGVEFEHIRTAQIKASQQAKSYSLLSTIDAAGEGKLALFSNKFVELADPSELIYPDGQRYLDRLKEAGEQYMILTHAVDENWQKLKLEATKLSKVPHIITFNKMKSEELIKWRSMDGKFSPPLSQIEPAPKLIFIDDRLRAFEGFPSDCLGFYIKRRQIDEDNPKLPANVVEISSFDEIIDKI